MAEIPEKVTLRIDDEQIAEIVASVNRIRAQVDDLPKRIEAAVRRGASDGARQKGAGR